METGFIHPRKASLLLFAFLLCLASCAAGPSEQNTAQTAIGSWNDLRAEAWRFRLLSGELSEGGELRVRNAVLDALELGFALKGNARALLSREGSFDFSKAEGIELRASNPTSFRLMLGLYLKAKGEPAQWGPVQSLGAGQSALLFFGLREGNFASDDSGMRAVEHARNPSSIEEWGLLLYGLESPEGRLTLSDFRLSLAETEAGNGPNAIASSGAASARGADSIEPPVIYDIKVLTAEPRLMELLESRVSLSVSYANPYDPGLIDLRAVWSAPSGKEYELPAFWYEDFERIDRSGAAKVSPKGGSGEWRARFAPDEEGEWGLSFVARTPGGESVSGKKLVRVGRANPSSAASKGYVGVSKDDGRYFAYADGSTYLAIGANVAWYDRRGIAAYDAWFGEMGRAGANFARLWFASWGFGIEWRDTGLGDYGARQKQAWELDYVVALAERQGIKLQMCLLNHGAFSVGTNPEWDQNPYNVAAGGFLDEPAEFLSDERAKELFKRRLRYTIARWGYSSAILSWELWNEVNFATGIMSSPYYIPWLDEMAAYIRDQDMGRHLVSTSYGSAPPADAPDWRAMDYAQEHAYGLGDWAAAMNARALEARAKSGKPFLYGEFGISGDVPDEEGIHLHDGMWGAVMSGCAGTGMLWWWDEYIEPKGLYGLYKGIASFFQGENLAALGLSPIETDYQELTEVYALKGRERSFIWVKDWRYSFEGLMDMAFEFGLDGVAYEALPETSYRLPVELPGTYEAWWYSTLSGEPMRSSVHRAFEGPDGWAIELAIPSFAKSVACKLTRLP
jgi:hypothetical protein